MKYLYILIALFFSVDNVFSQLKPLSGEKISINYNKTTHIIFPSEIKYFSTVSELIVAEKDNKLLSLKANVRNINKTTNLAVATNDGKFYNYEIVYNDTLLNTTYLATENRCMTSYNIEVNMNNDVHIIFPSEINYVDFGTDKIEVEFAEELQNIIRIKTIEEFNFQTNITVRTKDNKYYTINVTYNTSASQYNFSFGKEDVILSKKELSDSSKLKIANKIKELQSNMVGLGIKKNKISFIISNIYVLDNKLIFKITVSNLSNINYDIDYLKFFIEDKKTSKNTTSQEIEVVPLFVENYIPIIKGKTSCDFIVCFEKFTIPNEKVFRMEMNEKGGGRHIVYKLKNKDIINAENL